MSCISHFNGGMQPPQKKAKIDEDSGYYQTECKITIVDAKIQKTWEELKNVFPVMGGSTGEEKVLRSNISKSGYQKPAMTLFVPAELDPDGGQKGLFPSEILLVDAEKIVARRRQYTEDVVSIFDRETGKTRFTKSFEYRNGVGCYTQNKVTFGWKVEGNLLLGADYRTNALEIYDCTTGKLLKKLDNVGEGLKFAQVDGDTILTVSTEEGIKHWCLESGKVKWEQNDWIGTQDYRCVGNFLFHLGDYDTTIINKLTGKEVLKVRDKINEVYMCDGEIIVETYHTLSVWKILNKNSKTSSYLTGNGPAQVYGNRLVTAPHDIEIWDVKKREKISTIEADGVDALHVADDKIFVANRSNIPNFSWIRVYDFNSSKLLFEEEIPVNKVCSIRVDNNTIFTTSNHSVQIWEPSNTPYTLTIKHVKK